MSNNYFAYYLKYKHFKKELISIKPIPASHGCLLGFRITDEYADNSAIFTRFIFQTAIQDFDAAL